MTPPITIPQAFDATAASCRDLPALRWKEDGAWQSLSWGAYRQQVHLAARGLIGLGLEAGKGVAIIGYNCPEWLVADLAAIHAGALPSGIYTTCTAEQCQYVAHHCEAQIAVVENAEQLAKFLAVRDGLPHLRAIVQMHGEPAAPGVLSWEQLLRRGHDVPEPALAERVARQQPDDVATLIYTSGTTGVPKAVMLSHDNVVWTAGTGIAALGIRAGDNILSYLPLSHIAEQIVSIFGPVNFGGCTWFAQSMETLGDDLREIRPDFFLGVPRVWEKIQERMQAAGAQSSPLRKRLIAWARRVGLAAGYADQTGRRRPAAHGLANALVFRKVRARLGLDRARVLVTSAAPIARSTLEFFLSLGMPICEVYGMSECTGPATISTPARYCTGKAGYVFPGAELKTEADGEVCMRGRHVFKGYYKDAAATAEALDADGWLHSGDIGEIDADGFLQITDRKKDIIITAGGENVAPQLVEGMLKGIPVVSQAVVVGDRRRYLGALITLDPQRLPQDAAEAGSPARDPAAAATCAKFRAYLQSHIDAVNARLARVQAVKRFEIVPREFTVEGGELTPSLKVRRRVVAEKYAAEIERLFT
ncbi:MAG TPA: AMP-binding protein [Gemmatimonadaceae bacterium]|nr:AMP-binding protein [Gemmatimonadaceae bacterium]